MPAPEAVFVAASAGSVFSFAHCFYTLHPSMALGLVLLRLAVTVGVIVQCVYIFRAAMTVPPSSPLMRLDCYASVSRLLWMAGSAPSHQPLPLQAKGGKRVNSGRDCGAGQGPVCSLREPCTPCLDVVNGIAVSDSSCQSCGGLNLGQCFFLDLVGPYCRYHDGRVRACDRCCS